MAVKNAGKSPKNKANYKKSSKKGSARRKKGKNSSSTAVFLCILAAALGILVGLLVCRAVTAGDEFSLIGDSEIVCTVGDDVTYKDEGVRILSLGRDISSKVSVQTDLKKADGGYIVDCSKEGVYFIKYTVDDIKYGQTVRIRTIRVEGEDE